MFYVSDQYVFPHTKEQSTNTDTPVKREPTAANAKGKRHSDHNKPKRATQKDKASTGARPKESAKDTRNGKGSWLSSIDLDHIRTDSRHGSNSTPSTPSSTNPRQPEVWEELYDLYYRKGEEQPNLTISQFGNERRSPPRNYNNREPQQRSRSPRSCQSSPPAYRDTHHPRSRHATDYGKQSYASDSIYTYSSDSRRVILQEVQRLVRHHPSQPIPGSEPTLPTSWKQSPPIVSRTRKTKPRPRLLQLCGRIQN